MHSEFKKEQTTIYRLRDGFNFASIILDGNNVIIDSSYGVYAHYWSHPGPEGIKSFITKAEDSYVMGKFSKGKREFLLDESLEEVKKHVLDGRRKGGLSKEVAREAFGGMLDIKDNYINNEALFVQAIFENEVLSKIFSDYDTIPLRISFERSLTMFMEVFWSQFKQIISDEIE